MTRTNLALLLSLAAVAIAAGPAAARTHANTYDAHCVVDTTASPEQHQMRCLIEEQGKYDIDAEARFKNGAPMASAELFISLDGHPCGKSETLQFTGRASVFTGCRRRKLDGARHEVTLRVVHQMADYDDMHVTVVRRP